MLIKGMPAEINQGNLSAKIKPGTGGGAKTVRGTADTLRYQTAIKSATGAHKAIDYARKEVDPVTQALQSDAFVESGGETTLAAKRELNKKADSKLAKETSSKVKQATINQETAVLAEASKTFLLLLKEKAGDLMPKFLANKKEAEKNKQEKSNFMNQITTAIEDPKQVAPAVQSIVKDNLKTEKEKAVEAGDKEELAKLEALEAEINPLINMDLDASGQYISSESLLSHISQLDKTDIPDSVKPLIPKIKDKMFKLMQATKRYLGLSKELENHILSVAGVDTRVDKQAFREAYARAGSMVADRNGVSSDIAQNFNYKDDDVLATGTPFEHNPDEYGISQANFPVQRLLWAAIAPAQNRTFTGVGVDEFNPAPDYVLTA